MKKLSTAARQRIAIAKDVLKQIAGRRVKIKRGGFIVSPDTCTVCTINQKNIRTNQLPVCEVCAIGAAVWSGIRLYNKLSIRETTVCTRTATNWFDPKQARLIEIAFESGFGENRPRNDLERKAAQFGRYGELQATRAQRIFKNIIKNRGEFVP